MPSHTLMSLFAARTEGFPDDCALRVKRSGSYEDVSWSELAERVYEVAAGLIASGVQPGDRVGLLSENRLEWIIADYAILAVRAVTVALHALSSASQVQTMLADCTPSLVFVSNSTQKAKVRSVRANLPGVFSLCCFEGAAGDEGAEIETLAALEERGRALLAADPEYVRRRLRLIEPDDLAAILYTSGTTGDLKGVMLTHRNFVFTVQARSRYITIPDIENIENPVALLCLPLSHVYARTCDLYAGLEAGRTVALAESMERALQNCRETRPHFLSSVPRLYEKMASVARPQWGAGDRDVLSRLLGGRIRYCGCGGGALGADVARFFEEAGLPIYQGYGLTETSPTISANSPGHNKPWTAGRPVPGIEVKIAADGEILTRGPHVMRGYWANDGATAEVLDSEGWLRTGDLGKLDEDGFLEILGRKKDLIITAYGKNIAPQPIENQLCLDPLIEQAFVYGDNKPFLTALIIPAEAALQEWAGLHDLAGMSHADLAALDAVHSLFRERIDRAQIDSAPYERIRRFILLPDPFTMAKEEITIIAKLRRHTICNHYKDVLEELYRA